MNEGLDRLAGLGYRHLGAAWGGGRCSVRIAEEVAEALSANRAVVALESSVVAQGLPAPLGLRAAAACESAIREAGAIPATVAVIGGELVVGAGSDELQRLADPGRKVAKAAARDLGALRVAGADAGTTVSATIHAASRAGIRLFATGGIGGVHRGAAHTFDVSADLPALAAHRVAVVCAGAKAILDLPATLEMLETLGVPVVGLGVDELPAFYGNRSGLPLEHRVEDAAAAARLLDAHWRALELRTGVLFANPVPAEAELQGDAIEAAIGAALLEAEAKGIEGKAATPFLLSRLAADATLGTLDTNLAVLLSNAAAAGRIAVALQGAA